MIYPLLPCNVCNDATPEWIGRHNDPNWCMCPGCGCKREQDYNQKGVAVDMATTRVLTGEDAVSELDTMTPSYAKKVQGAYLKAGGADVANSIDTRTGKVRHVNQAAATKFRKVKEDLKRDGIIPG